MSELPSDRLQASPYCGVDLFGPFTIKNYRKELKSYGIMFICLCSRAIHIEVVQYLETDSFILSLRQIIGRRGNICLMKFDNGINFVSAIKELRQAFQKMDHNQISQYLQRHGADWRARIRKPLTASHMGGVWEQQIRTARTMLNALLKTHGRSLDDELLYTLLIELKAIVNSRPMTTGTINYVQSHVPLSPSNLLTMNSKVVMSPPGRFRPADTYCRKRWRRTQHIAN